MMNINRPSFVMHALNAIFLAVALGAYMYHYSDISVVENITLLFLASIAMGIHSITHNNEEVYHLKD